MKAEGTAMVSGASRGIGRCLALELAARGFEVVAGEMGENVVMWLVAESRYPANRVRHTVSDWIEPRLLRVSGVASLMVVGGEEREIRVQVDPERLEKLRQLVHKPPLTAGEQLFVLKALNDGIAF